MSKGKRRRKQKRQSDVSPAWGSLNEALQVVEKLDADLLEQICSEVQRLAQGTIREIPDDEDYPLPPVMIALAGYFESLALQIRGVWIRQMAGDDSIQSVEQARKAGVLEDIQETMRQCAAWRAVGVLMGQQHREQIETAADLKPPDVVSMARSVHEDAS